MRYATTLRGGVSLFVISIAAQGGMVTAAEQERQLGAKVGPVFSTLAIEPADSEDYRMRAGVTGGAFAVLPLAPGLAIQFEGLFTQKGGKLDVPEIEETASILLDYVEFPVLLRVNAPRSGRLAFHAFAGPAAGFRASARRQFSLAGGGFTSGVSEDISDEIRRFELSLVAGAGVDITPRVVIDGRYSWGLTSVNRDTTGDFHVRTRVLAIMAGVRF